MGRAWQRTACTFDPPHFQLAYVKNGHRLWIRGIGAVDSSS